MNVTDFKSGQIALACWCAAPGELHQVALAVCQVFMNRAKAGWYEGDLYENCWRWLSENPPEEFPDCRDPQFAKLLNRLETVTSGLVVDVTGGAIYFCPKNQLAEKVEGIVTTTIGSLVFVK
jgi:hypothetical protein